MKNIKKYSWAVAAVLTMGITSCGDDFLTEEPASQLPLDGYYNSESRCLEAATAAYHPMQWFDYFNGWAPLNIMWDSMSDDLYVGGGSTSDQSQLHLISQYKSDPRNSVGGAWTTAYSGINRSIRLIEDAEQLPEGSARNAFIAEGKTLRAWYYLVLWKTWGNVPLYMENLTLPYIAPQAKADEVYNTIVPDLEEVLDADVLPMKRPDAEAGRMTFAAAAMIYADYVMYQKDQSRYSKALAYMEKIISSGQYSLVAGADYDQLFDLGHEWNSEIILDINFISNGGKRDWGAANTTGGTVLPALIGIDGLSYNGTGKNVKEGASTEFVGGWGFGAVSKEVYDAFEPGDLRRDVALLNMDQYMEDMLADGIVVTYGGRYQNTGIFLRKYLGRPGGTEGAQASSDLNWDNNLHLYRYAETLLNAAELALATGSGKAQQYFDQVRSRAGLASKTVSEDNILAERRVEFVGEGKRYFDLVRTGRAASVLKAGGGVVLQSKRTMTWNKNDKGELESGDKINLSQVKFEGTCSWGGQAIPERVAWTENKKYLPIPQGEIEAANGVFKSPDEPGHMTQNPY